MSGLSKMIADFFVRENVIEHEEYEIYKYGSDILIAVSYTHLTLPTKRIV